MGAYIYKAKTQKVRDKKIGVFSFWYKPFIWCSFECVPSWQKRKETITCNMNHQQYDYVMMEGSEMLYNGGEIFPVLNDSEPKFETVFNKSNIVGSLKKEGKRWKIVLDIKTHCV